MAQMKRLEALITVQNNRKCLGRKKCYIKKGLFLLQGTQLIYGLCVGFKQPYEHEQFRKT